LGEENLPNEPAGTEEESEGGEEQTEKAGIQQQSNISISGIETITGREPGVGIFYEQERYVRSNADA